MPVIDIHVFTEIYVFTHSKYSLKLCGLIPVLTMYVSIEEAWEF